MSFELKVRVQGTERWRKLISRLRGGVRRAAVMGWLSYMIGNDEEGFKSYPEYKHVTRKSAYGVFAFSDAQRHKIFAIMTKKKWVFAPSRTMVQREGWRIQDDGSSKLYAVNNAPGIAFTKSPKKQSRHEKAVGWTTTTQDIRKWGSKAIKAARLAVKDYIYMLKRQTKE